MRWGGGVEVSGHMSRHVGLPPGPQARNTSAAAVGAARAQPSSHPLTHRQNPPAPQAAVRAGEQPPRFYVPGRLRDQPPGALLKLDGVESR